jgi:hypothetical protein
LIKKNEKSLNSFTKIFESHGRFLTKVLKTMETIDETMGCILCAIRQNEYLQTYYPAQHGFPAMKTTGLHPAKTVKECKK